MATMKYCSECGARISRRAKACPKCGFPFDGSAAAKAQGHSSGTVSHSGGKKGSKNSALAAVLSFFIPGLGQAYNGKWMKGIVMFIASMIIWSIVVFGAVFTLGFGIICLPAGFLPNIYAAYDAYQDAK
ncbi:hypothetical protein COU37_01185 [Candidatus Micrarchaeota archaeon CG10_big_fil_rev_8_21_14_0_10_45_29]|nr:MAG: hypothetical protein COU37_01185 [Candidatus Micrarchaeota archaeon CG10_big_fil_rev_8_21_14_0_10_45_29]